MDQKEGLPDQELHGVFSTGGNKRNPNKLRSLASSKKLRAARAEYLRRNRHAIDNAVAELKGDRFSW
ncbi:MAG: hypothetical protein RLZZ283_649 [Candidatus Parcubacteria bacterium]|jgi:hypothetical protein